MYLHDGNVFVLASVLIKNLVMRFDFSFFPPFVSFTRRHVVVIICQFEGAISREKLRAVQYPCSVAMLYHVRGSV